MTAAPIVVGFVSTAEGHAALEAAIEEAERRGGRLVVVTSHRGGAALGKDEATQLDHALEEVRERLGRSGLPYDVRALIRGNDVAEDVIATAEEVDAALIVIGLRRRSPVGKLLLGSNSQQILLDAPCDVLAVKAD